MNTPQCPIVRSLVLLLVFIGLASATLAQQNTGSLRGQLTDELGGAIVGATITLINASGASRNVIADDQGIYQFSGVAPGRYTVRASATNFAVYENTEVDIRVGQRETLDIRLGVALAKEEVTVGSEPPISIDPSRNADALVLRGKDLDALPDDPEALSSALQALAGPSVGPNGGEIYIDGFTGGRLPPKESIREVRVNQNPFNAENSFLGFGRIDILTKPGTDRLRGSAFYNFSDEKLNARNPFAPTRAPYLSRLYGGTLGGTIVPKKASFFLDFQRRDVDENGIVNARVLDDFLNVTQQSLTVITPTRFTTFSPRFDYQLNENHTLVARYSLTRSTFQNQGIGGFTLPERGFASSSTQHTFQLTETAVLSPRLINETRFQYIRDRRQQEDTNASPSIIVQEAFLGGGPGIGLAYVNSDRYELQNYSTTTLGNHILRFGVRLRGVRITDASPSNFNGTFIFAGGTAPRLDANNQIMRDAAGNPELVPITSLERYRRTLLFQRQGFSPADVRAFGGGASLFSIAGGDPIADVSQTDLGGFIQDEWRLRPNLTLTLGLRYEAQTNINSKMNFGPRIFFAWAPGGTATGTIFGSPGTPQPKFVLRGGFGIFYDRFSESGTLQANRFNGINQQRFNVIDPSILDLFPIVPSVNTLTGFAQPQVITRVASDLQAAYSTVTSLQVERQLPGKFTVYVVLFNYRTHKVLRMRNVNAPLPGTFDPRVPNSGERPFGNVGDIYQFESSGNFNDYRMFSGIRNQLRPGFSIFANYSTGWAKSDTDCIFGGSGGCFPANSYDLSGEYARAALPFLARHSFFFGGTLGIPQLKLAINPFIIARSGPYFNITTGRDSNGDRLYLERPALATERTNPRDLRRTPYGDFDLNPAPGVSLIPRNYGQGPGFFSVNLSISRTFGFGTAPQPAAAAPASAAPSGGAQPASSTNSSRSSSSSSSGSSNTANKGSGSSNTTARGANSSKPPQPEKRYNVTLGLQIWNLFNHTNVDAPIGNLSSPLFGQSIRTTSPFGFGGTSSSNRRIEAQLRFNF